MILLSGDIHLGCAHRIRFPGVDLYQLLSSGVTYGAGPLVGLGSKLLIRSNLKFETLDHTLGGRIHLLEKEAAGDNPCTGLNIGIVDIAAPPGSGRPEIRFHLYGNNAGRPVRIYRSTVIGS